METIYGDKAMKKITIYAILKKVKGGKNQRHLNPKKTVRTASLIASVATAIEEDCRQYIKSLAAVHGVSVYTIHSILHKDTGLE
jgi:hypothetical protein